MQLFSIYKIPFLNDSELTAVRKTSNKDKNENFVFDRLSCLLRQCHLLFVIRSFPSLKTCNRIAQHFPYFLLLMYHEQGTLKGSPWCNLLI